MSLSDPVADFLTCVRNASRAHKEALTVPSSKMKERIADILKDEAFIKNYKIVEEGNKKFIRIYLKYLKNKKPAITNLKRVSRPGLRRYVDSHRIPRVLRGLGVVIMSTSQGVITGKKAYNIKIGGEVICKVW